MCACVCACVPHMNEGGCPTYFYRDPTISIHAYDRYGSHTFKNVNEKGEAVYVKYHFKTDQARKGHGSPL